MDNFITGNPDNIAHLLGNERFEFIHHDVSTYIYVDGPARRRPALRVAGEPGRLPRAADPDAQGRLARHAQRARPRQGEGRALPPGVDVRGLRRSARASADGDYWGNVNPIGPRGVYDEAKRFAEAMTMAYHRYHGVDTRIVRIFNTYGPRMRPRDGRVVSNFIVQALRGEPLTVYGDGIADAVSFCYVDDQVEGIYRLFMRGDQRADEHRQPERVHRAAVRRARRRADRHEVADRSRAAARRTTRRCGKPDITRARDDARLGAEGRRCGTASRARSSTSEQVLARRRWRLARRASRPVPSAARRVI